MKYDEVFINYCRDIMTKEGFEIYMAFLGVEDEDVNRSLLKKDFEGPAHLQED